MKIFFSPICLAIFIRKYVMKYVIKESTHVSKQIVESPDVTCSVETELKNIVISLIKNNQIKEELKLLMAPLLTEIAKEIVNDIMSDPIIIESLSQVLIKIANREDIKKEVGDNTVDALNTSLNDLLKTKVTTYFSRSLGKYI